MGLLKEERAEVFGELVGTGDWAGGHEKKELVASESDGDVITADGSADDV